MEIRQRSIWLCDRDLEGRKNKCDFRCHKDKLPKNKLVKEGQTEPTPHWFIIISKKPTYGFITVLPITSKEHHLSELGAEQINEEDVVESANSSKIFPFNKKTYVLCNQPCRIPTEDLEGKEDYGFIERNVYRDLIDSVRISTLGN